MSENERDNTGRYVETVTLAKVRSVFTMVRGPTITSSDVSELLGCSQETARRKLRELEQKEQIASRKTGGRVVWWEIAGQQSLEPVDPADPFWELVPNSSGESNISERVDNILYGNRSA